MKTILLITIVLGLYSCAPASSNSGNTIAWTQPTTPAEAQSLLAGKRFNGVFGNYIQFNNDGSFQAVYTGLYNELTGNTLPDGFPESFQKTFKCTVTATSYAVTAIGTLGYGEIVVTLTNANAVQSGITGTPSYNYGCFRIGSEINFNRTTNDTLKHRLSIYRRVFPPLGQGWYEGTDFENYTLQ